MALEIGFRLDSRPHIKRRHIDGPLLIFSDGQLHWLTWRERIRLWLGWTDAERLQRERRPKFAAYLDKARAALAAAEQEPGRD